MDSRAFRACGRPPHGFGRFSGPTQPFCMFLDVSESYDDALDDCAHGSARILSANVRKLKEGGVTCPEMSANVRKSGAKTSAHENEILEIRSGNLFMPDDSGMHFYMFNNFVKRNSPYQFFAGTQVVRKCPQMSANPEIQILRTFADISCWCDHTTQMSERKA